MTYPINDWLAGKHVSQGLVFKNKGEGHMSLTLPRPLKN
ncbi:hypothetical protein A33Q_1836 [Indibacter alkaliphilus LW1]|uniref:Uncharacterized protein n=1 Tax=Indibacter alkaliphilus (strain CCUG 57479 / KCTC 22604 / LW1) TaxID=1189612 RepID=S2E4M4_INDAL|nr:hypothetical protein A33Q_1836 [Indibacter alkaliphilus LW1]